MKIVAASCSKLKQTDPQPVWGEIAAEQPDALLLLGDTIYLGHDHHSQPDPLRLELRELYKKQLAEPHFKALLADMQQRNAPVIAIYDDHDFLGNNRYGGDHDPALRQVAREEFLLAFPGSAPPGADLYRRISLGPVDIIVLDERFYRRSPQASGSDRDAILGDQQWAWFEDVARSSHAKFLLVASSSTIHTFGDESWEQYPAAFQRLRTLLTGRVGALVVSGDVHRNALYDDSGVVEVVTSGVARDSLVFGKPRKNYGVLDFGADSVRIQLKSLKAGWRFDVTVALNAWHF